MTRGLSSAGPGKVQGSSYRRKGAHRAPTYPVLHHGRPSLWDPQAIRPGAATTPLLSMQKPNRMRAHSPPDRQFPFHFLLTPLYSLLLRKTAKIVCAYPGFYLSPFLLFNDFFTLPSTISYLLSLPQCCPQHPTHLWFLPLTDRSDWDSPSLCSCWTHSHTTPHTSAAVAVGQLRVTPGGQRGRGQVQGASLSWCLLRF